MTCLLPTQNFAMNQCKELQIAAHASFILSHNPSSYSYVAFGCTHALLPQKRSPGKANKL